MMICTDYKLRCLQVPHTASTDIANFLLRKMGGTRVLGKHRFLPEFKTHFPQEYKTYYGVCGLRNPFCESILIYNKLRSDHGGRYSDKKPENGRMPTRIRERVVHRKI